MKSHLGDSQGNGGKVGVAVVLNESLQLCN